MAAPIRTWTDDRVDELLHHLSRRMTTGQIARHMAISRSAVSGQIHRMKQSDKDRLVAAGYGEMEARGFDGGQFNKERNTADMNTLADLLAENRTVPQAAIAMNVTIQRADQLFYRICKKLGWQAR